jgi:16S rRNA (guanine1207-N2)-methyltransferase
MATGSQPHPSGRRSTEHYFAAEPGTRSRPGEVSLDLPGLHLELRTDRGVFSPSRIDPGTQVLLEALPELSRLPRGDLVDLGCGYGPIACALASRDPSRHVWAVDVNARARELCEHNAAAAGLDASVTVLSEGDRPAAPLAAIVSNPPVRIGKEALHALLLTWLDLLVEGGEAWMVVHRHLGADSLARWLQERGWATDRVRSRKGYRVLRITRPTTDATRAPAGRS